MDNIRFCAYDWEYEVELGMDEDWKSQSIIFCDERETRKEKFRCMGTDEERRRSEPLVAFLEDKAQRRRDKCCIKCQKMTGTLEGLRALVGDGYRHYSYYQLLESAGMGCQFCRLIYYLTANDEWECEQIFEDNKLSVVTDTKILIRAVNDDVFNNDGSLKIPRSEVDGWRTQVQLLAESTDDAIYRLQLNSLSVTVPWDGDSVAEPLDGHIPAFSDF